MTAGAGLARRIAARARAIARGSRARLPLTVHGRILAAGVVLPGTSLMLGALVAVAVTRAALVGRQLEDLARRGRSAQLALAESLSGARDPRAAGAAPQDGLRGPHLAAALRSLARTLDADIWLLDSAGNVVAWSGPVPDTTPRALGEVAARALAGEAVAVPELPGVRQEAAVAALPLAAGPERGVLVLVDRGPPADVALARLWRGLFLILAPVLILLSVLGSHLAVSVSRSLRRLAVAMDEVAAGLPPLSLPRGGQDEVADLAARLERLLTAMRERAGERARLLAEVAHELKSSLTVIHGYAEAMRDGVVGAGEGHRHYHEVLIRETQRVTRLLEDLVDLGRLDSGAFPVSPRPVDLAALASGVVTALQPAAASRGNLLELVPASAPAAVVADPDRVEQILKNLVRNSIQATRGGRITVRVHADDTEAVLEVEDTGVGIPPEALSRIWRHFERIPRESAGELAGAGLGLAIARKLVELQGGHIHVQSRPGVGSRFTVRFPRLTAPGNGTPLRAGGEA